MENASKALIIAGSVLIALMIIGALLLMFNNLSSYQNTETQGAREAQVVEFNNQYETYNRDDVRGSDMVSLINKIIDYNKRKNEEGYDQMDITITIDDPSKFAYDKGDVQLIKEKYTQNNLEDLVGTKENENTPKGLERKYGEKYIRDLSSNISNIMDDSKSEDTAEKILPKDLSNYGGISKIQADTSIYYEYSQFKRARFNCTHTDYSKIGRIKTMNFEFLGKFN